VKIIDVRMYSLRAPLDEPFGFSQGWYDSRAALIVEVLTDEGISGFGEAAAPPGPTRAAIEDILVPVLRGLDPMAVDVAWQVMYNRVRDYGPKGISVAAISAIDIALWDIRGKITGLPVYQLLGGTFRRRVQAYVTGMYRSRADDWQDRIVKEAKSYVGQGYSALKLKIGWGLSTDIGLVRAVRQGVGPEIMIMIDANRAYDAATAIQLGSALEEQNIAWFEEPVPADDLAGYARVRSKLRMPIAGGEGEFTRYGFKNLIMAGAVDIVQPECCAAGGITECRYIAVMAQAWGIRCIPHVWGTGIALAVALQFIAAIPDCPPSLYPRPPLLEFDRTPNPLRDAILTSPILANEGWLEVPDGPGLGIEVNRATLERWKI
jgi:D-galactarolactone cycloisomerase